MFFFNLTHICETILCFYPNVGTTNYVKCKTVGLQGDPPEFIVFCLVTLHLWGRIFKKFPDLRGLVNTDDGNIIGRFSQALRIMSEFKSGFKLNGNFDFNLGKTMFLTKDTTARHVYERVQVFLQNDPSLQDIVQDFTPNMFSVQGIEVLGTPIGTDT